ncbi:MAG: hypothetical protein MnENMB40S_34010 [Rhizobiaceae bacterium MnEN-MB40S]|nr:MAG: hypothetical protein MnENMB40S_34010 [Rhizobiaceae bacterium MnEN-MB40S]
MKSFIFKYPVVVLFTIPAIIAFSIGALAPILVVIESRFDLGVSGYFILKFNDESARSVLSAIAGAAITTLSLTYSLVLVVFTLAAGNIGPRLLKRFSTETVNQVTAGLFGGTFLYALVALAFVHPNFVPRITVGGAVLLSMLCVFQLIFFVRHVSESVSIDDEIAKITMRLGEALTKHMNRVDEAGDSPDIDCEEGLDAGSAGYIGAIAEDDLVALANREDIVVRVVMSPGGFVLSDETLLALSKQVGDDVADEIRKLVHIEPSRSQSRPIEFNIHLLVEIALRALSPGVNDAYTAIAAIDSLSSALARIADRTTRPLFLCDEKSKVRVVLPELSFGDLLGQAFHPLRRASADNLPVAQALARALARLYGLGNKENDEVLTEHAQLLIMELKRSGHFDHDIDSVRSNLPASVREIDLDEEKAPTGKN